MLNGTTSYLAEHAWLAGGVDRDVRIAVRDGRIVAVEPQATVRPGDVRLAGLVLPGFANTHSHAFHRALRGRTQADRGTFWTWRQQMYALADRIDPDSYLALARATYAEMALAGVTAVGEFHYLHHARGGRPYADPNAMGRALIQAAGDAGIRLTLLDTCYIAGGLDFHGHTPLDTAQERFSDGSADAWADRVSLLADGDQVRIGAAVHSVRTVPAAEIPAVVAAARSRPLHVHLSEQPAENEQCAAVYRRTPTAVLQDAGALGGATTAVHATHLSADDVRLLGASRTAISVCPTTERDLADGIAAARLLLDAGSPITVGSDQHVVVDLLEETRAVEMDERLATGRRGRFTPEELITALTAAGQRSLGWPDGGVLRVGARADLVAVRLDSVRTAGCRPDQAIYAATASDVHAVLIDGRSVVWDGVHLLGDVGALLGAAIGRLMR